MASFTDTTITSPTVAYLRLEPPSTLMHWTRRAPELSATSRLVCIWIIGALLLGRGFGRRGVAGGAPGGGSACGHPLLGGLPLARRRRSLGAVLRGKHHETLVLGDR